MKKSLIFKSFLMMVLIVMLPMSIPVTLADSSGEPMPTPAEQCEDKSLEGEEFVELMDNGIIKTLEIVASVMFAVATIVNTIDYFITLVSTGFGMMGADGSACCIPALVNSGVCAKNWFEYTSWTAKKNAFSSIFLAITNFATCACCSGGGRKADGGSNTASGLASNWDLCPLGNLADMMGDALPGEPTKPGTWGENEKVFGGEKLAGSDDIKVSSDLVSGNKITGMAAAEPAKPAAAPAATTDTSLTSKDMKEILGPVNTGIGQFHVSAFDNIYMAVGCLCPVAILFNLRKLKTIYQVHNCCVEQACANGQSTEVCDRQFDEATCMYWEGSILKTLIAVIGSIVAGYIAKMIWKQIGDSMLVKCALAFLELIRIPGRIQAVIGAFDWVGKTFSEPECEDLGFDDIEEMFESGYDSQSAGINDMTLNDNNGDGIYDRADSRYKELSLTAAEKTGTAQGMDYKIVDNYGNAIGYRKGNSMVGTDGSAMSSQQFQQVLQQAASSEKITSTSLITANGAPLLTSSTLKKGDVIEVPEYGTVTLGNKQSDGTFDTSKGKIEINSEEDSVTVEIAGNEFKRTAYDLNNILYEVETDSGALSAKVYVGGAVIDARNFKNGIPQNAILDYGNEKKVALGPEQLNAIYPTIQSNIANGDFSTISNFINEADINNVDLTKATYGGQKVTYENSGKSFVYDLGSNKAIVDYTNENNIKIIETRTYTHGADSIVQYSKNTGGVITSFNMDAEEYRNNLAGVKITQIKNNVITYTKDGKEMSTRVSQDGKKITYYGDESDSSGVKVTKEVEINVQDNLRIEKVTTFEGGTATSYVLRNELGEVTFNSQQQWEAIGGGKVDDAQIFDAYQTFMYMGYDTSGVKYDSGTTSFYVDYSEGGSLGRMTYQLTKDRSFIISDAEYGSKQNLDKNLPDITREYNVVGGEIRQAIIKTNVEKEILDNQIEGLNNQLGQVGQLIEKQTLIDFPPDGATLTTTFSSNLKIYSNEDGSGVIRAGTKIEGLSFKEVKIGSSDDVSKSNGQVVDTKVVNAEAVPVSPIPTGTTSDANDLFASQTSAVTDDNFQGAIDVDMYTISAISTGTISDANDLYIPNVEIVDSNSISDPNNFNIQDPNSISDPNNLNNLDVSANNDLTRPATITLPTGEVKKASGIKLNKDDIIIMDEDAGKINEEFGEGKHVRAKIEEVRKQKGYSEDTVLAIKIKDNEGREGKLVYDIVALLPDDIGKIPINMEWKADTNQFVPTVNGRPVKIENNRVLYTDNNRGEVAPVPVEIIKLIADKAEGLSKEQVAKLNTEIEKKNAIQEKLNKEIEEKQKKLKELEEKQKKELAKRESRTKALKNSQMQKVAYNVVWELTNLLLQEFAYPMVDEMCKEDWEASEPATPPTDTNSGNPGTGQPGGVFRAECTGPTIAAQLKYEGSKYKISYTVTGCGSITRFIVYLKSPTAPDYVIVSNGYAANGQAVSDDPEITAAASYTEVCVEISGLARCFPKA